ncbi:CBS domain-containing protein [Nonomuraea sp. NPDC049784]|uniref:CBS domain-containing protein n=1 Tax=Nonomuraea sp. NPDC049784 TaxID=3154361 RepID=UPI003403B344
MKATDKEERRDRAGTRVLVQKPERSRPAMRMTVADVMTSKVVLVTAATSVKDIAEALVTGGVSAVPVLDDDDHVIGMVSEADLLRKEEFREEFYREGYRPPLRARLRHPKGRRKAEGDTAAELMTSPAITISPDASAVAAARLMEAHDVKRLAVVNYNGRRTEAAIAARMTARVNGVVDVINKITWKTDDSKWEAR